MRLTAASTTQEVLREIGGRLKSYRLQQNVTVAQLAAQSGVAPRSINRSESGENASLETLIKLLRALGRLDVLDGFLPPPPVSPIQLAALSGHQRQRASGRRGKPTATRGAPNR